MSNFTYGPALPPGFSTEHTSGNSSPSQSELDVLQSHSEQMRQKPTKASDVSSTNSSTSEAVVIGPSLPEFLQHQRHATGDDIDSARDKTVVMGPSVPSSLNDKESVKVPAVNTNPSPHLRDSLQIRLSASPSRCTKPVIVGPSLPSNLERYIQPKDDEVESEEENDTLIGPLPANVCSSNNALSTEFEERAQKMKAKLEGKSNIEEPQRESWMTELPPEISKNFGLGPRSFRRNVSEKGDRSVWTDTPADKERKRKEFQQKPSASQMIPKAKDEVKVKQVKEYNETERPESLMEMHTKALKRKHVSDTKSLERRPFDRDSDLQANRFDEAQRQSIMKKARGLNDRFKASEQKFLE